MESSGHSRKPIGESQAFANLTDARNNVVDLLGEFLALMALPSTEDEPGDSEKPNLPPLPITRTQHATQDWATFETILNKQIADIPPLSMIREDPSKQSRDGPLARALVKSESETAGANVGQKRGRFASATNFRARLRDRLDIAVMTKLPVFVHKYMRKHGPTSGNALLRLLSNKTTRKAKIGDDGKLEVDSKFCEGHGGLYVFSRLAWVLDRHRRQSSSRGHNLLWAGRFRHNPQRFPFVFNDANMSWTKIMSSFALKYGHLDTTDMKVLLMTILGQDQQLCIAVLPEAYRYYNKLLEDGVSWPRGMAPSHDIWQQQMLLEHRRDNLARHTASSVGLEH